MIGNHQDPYEVVRNLAVDDHTETVLDILVKAEDVGLHVVRSLHGLGCCRPPSRRDLLRIVATTGSLEEKTRTVVASVAVLSDNLSLGNPAIPVESAQRTFALALEFAAVAELDEVRGFLQAAQEQQRDDEALSIGLETAIAILDAGGSTIYDDDYVGTKTTYAKKEKDGVKEDVKDLGKADAAGAVVGALGGAAAAGVGAGAGALAGGIGASTAKAVEGAVDAVVDWLF